MQSQAEPGKEQVMNSIDDKIREALRREDAELLKLSLEDSSLHDVLIESFRGKHRWLNVMAVVWTFVFVALAVVAAYQFFQAEDTQAMIAWATAFLWFGLWVAMIKIWFWMEMQRHPITREIKRLELRIAELSRELQQRQ
jgi:hypothetical protein